VEALICKVVKRTAWFSANVDNLNSPIDLPETYMSEST